MIGVAPSLISDTDHLASTPVPLCLLLFEMIPGEIYAEENSAGCRVKQEDGLYKKPQPLGHKKKGTPPRRHPLDCPA